MFCVGFTMLGVSGAMVRSELEEPSVDRLDVEGPLAEAAEVLERDGVEMLLGIGGRYGIAAVQLAVAAALLPSSSLPSRPGPVRLAGVMAVN